MPTFTACTLTESFDIIQTILQRGADFVESSTGFTRTQLANFIEQFYLKTNMTSTIERSMSKSLCCFLFELMNEGPSHYADIRSLVREKYNHQVNDYGSLQYWRLIEKSNRGLGYWRITERGIAFLQGQLTLAEKVTIKNKRVVGSSETRVSIADFDGLNFISYNPIILSNMPTDEI